MAPPKATACKICGEPVLGKRWAGALCHEHFRQMSAAKSEKYRQRHPERARQTVREYRLGLYGLTTEQYEQLLEAQGGKCAICRTAEVADSLGRVLHVDHDHSCCPGPTSCGACVRGLLCSRCNHLIGKAEDDVILLQNAIDYLDRYGNHRRELDGACLAGAAS